jgi:hypothetical protein
MLGRKDYPQDYIDHCRTTIDTQLAAYRSLDDGPPKDEFEPLFFNNLVLVLDYFFVHRLVMVAGKDGNPLNEVRVIAESLVLNSGVMRQDTSIKLIPEESVLNLQPGDTIRLTADDFERLAKAYFAEVEARFT